MNESLERREQLTLTFRLLTQANTTVDIGGFVLFNDLRVLAKT